jgi:hypothetical protein
MTPAKPPPPVPPDPVFARLREFLRRNREILVMMLSYCAIPPVLQFVFNVGPPWPHRTGVIAFTSIVGYVVAVLIFATNEYGAATQPRFRTVRKRLVSSAAVGACVMIIYVVLSAFFLYDAPSPPDQVAGGIQLRTEVREYIEKHPGYTEANALRDSAYDAEAVWIPWTVRLMNVSFLVSWLGFFGSLAAVIGLLVVYLRMLNVLEPVQTSP